MPTKYLVIGIVCLLGAVGIGMSQGWITLPSKDNSTPPDISSAPPEFAVVKRILDPITLELDSGHIVRYIGVKTPQVTNEIHCFGKEALLANESVIGKKIRLEEEPLLKRSSDGAWTRYVWLQPEEEMVTENEPSPTPNESSTSDTITPDLAQIADTAKDVLELQSPSPGAPVVEPSSTPEETPTEPEGPKEILINERILEGGFGFPVVSEDMKYGERMLSAAKYASATGKGLWSRCEVSEEGGLHTQTITECVIKGKVSADKEKLYRTPDCPAYAQTIPVQIDGGQWFCATDIAEDAGFTKAADCP